MDKQLKEHQLVCPDCNVRMALRGRSRLKYICPECNGSLIANVYGKPMGVPGTKEDRKWRRKAHSVFEQLWRDGLASRSASQRWLARQLGISPKQCHFGYMRADMLREAVRIVNDAREDNPSRPTAIDVDPVTSQWRSVASEAVRSLRSSGAKRAALGYWISTRIGTHPIDDVGGLRAAECERLVRCIVRAISGHGKLPRGTRLTETKRTRLLAKLSRRLADVEELRNTA